MTSTAEDAIAQLAVAPAFERVDTLRMDCFRTPALEALVASPLAPRLRHLDVGTTLSAPSWRALADSPSLAGLAELSVSGAMAGRSVPLVDKHGETLDYAPLFAARGLDSLRVLRLTSAWVDAARASALLESSLARRLELIDLRNNPWLKAHEAAALRDKWDGVLLVDPPK